MLFKRKKEPEIIEPPPCKHKWQDFPWYTEYWWDDNGNYGIQIFEPYVCIYCKERKDIELLHEEYNNATAKGREKDIAEIEALYKDHLQPRAVVEDKIHDFQLVDRQWLEIAKALREGKNDPV